MNHSGDTNKMVGADHFPDATKMVSDTPRTDAEECEMFIGVSTFTSGDVQQAFDFARQLERELAAANERIKRLEAVVNDPEALWTNWLRGTVKLPEGIGDVRQYQARIKRLEEAGKELRECASQLGWTSSEDPRWIERAEAAVKAWDKEAKP